MKKQELLNIVQDIMQDMGIWESFTIELKRHMDETPEQYMDRYIRDTTQDLPFELKPEALSCFVRSAFPWDEAGGLDFWIRKNAVFQDKLRVKCNPYELDKRRVKLKEYIELLKKYDTKETIKDLTREVLIDGAQEIWKF